MPVMIVTNIFVPRGIPFGLATVKKTLDLGANVVAIKDDMAGVFIERLCMNEHERVAIVAGGTKQLHLHMSPFGVDGYLSTMATYRPDVANRYWDAMKTNNLAEAREIVRTIDQPFFEHIMGLPWRLRRLHARARGDPRFCRPLAACSLPLPSRMRRWSVSAGSSPRKELLP